MSFTQHKVQEIITRGIFKGKELNEALIGIVAREAGIDLNSKNVEVRCFITSNSGSIGPIEYTAEVNITEKIND